MIKIAMKKEWMDKLLRELGGAGSGNYGHVGQGNGEVGGSGKGNGTPSPAKTPKGIPSQALEDAVKAAGKAMGEVKGNREQGYRDAAISLKKAADIAKQEGFTEMHASLIKKMDEYNRYADLYKPKN